MSCIHCDECCRLIDSDYDPDCFVDRDAPLHLPVERVLCERCREREWDRQQERMMEDAP